MIVYTSGTTGPPKGAVLSRRALAADLDGLADAWAWTPDDHLVHGLPLFHVHGLVLGVLGPLRVGSRLTHTVRPTPAAYAAAGGTMYFGVPTVWSRRLRRARRRTSAPFGSAPGVRQRAVARARVRPTRRAHRARTGRALRDDRDAHHAQHPCRRRATTGLGRRPHRRCRDAPRRRRRPAGAMRWRDGRPSPGARGDAVRRLSVRRQRRRSASTVGSSPAIRSSWTTSGSIGSSGGPRSTSSRPAATRSVRVRSRRRILGHPGVREVAVVGVDDADLGQRVVAFVVGRRCRRRRTRRVPRRHSDDAQASTRDPLRRRPAPQRDGQGAEVQAPLEYRLEAVVPAATRSPRRTTAGPYFARPAPRTMKILGTAATLTARLVFATTRSCHRLGRRRHDPSGVNVTKRRAFARRARRRRAQLRVGRRDGTPAHSPCGARCVTQLTTPRHVRD